MLNYSLDVSIEFQFHLHFHKLNELKSVKYNLNELIYIYVKWLEHALILKNVRQQLNWSFYIEVDGNVVHCFQCWCISGFPVTLSACYIVKPVGGVFMSDSLITLFIRIIEFFYLETKIILEINWMSVFMNESLHYSLNRFVQKHWFIQELINSNACYTGMWCLNLLCLWLELHNLC